MNKPPPSLAQRVFTKYDKDMSGAISVDEFKEMVMDMGHHLSDAELQVAVTQIGKDGSGNISFANFEKWWKNSDRFEKLHLSDAEHEALLQAVNYFRYFDKDGSGSLDRKEFPSLYADLVKNNFTKLSLEKCLGDLDKNHDGLISFNEYVDWLIRIGSLRLHYTV